MAILLMVPHACVFGLPQKLARFLNTECHLPQSPLPLSNCSERKPAGFQLIDFAQETPTIGHHFNRRLLAHLCFGGVMQRQKISRTVFGENHSVSLVAGPFGNDIGTTQQDILFIANDMVILLP
jgi:hypothetical protein